jgi:hypothetical protein
MLGLARDVKAQKLGRDEHRKAAVPQELVA